jgi:hypothetical protein
MRPSAAAFVLVLLAAGPGRADDPPREDRDVERAIDKALIFLKNSQRDDGSWSAGRAGGLRSPAVTGLCVRAFLSAGYVPGDASYGDSIERGLRYVLRTQRSDGVIASEAALEMYSHGICALMLAEAAAVTEGPLADDLRRRLDRAVAVLLKAQRKKGADEGGWRYNVAGSDSDMSVTGWQVMALGAAKDLGCDVPPEALERAVAYVKRAQELAGGGFRYTPFGRPTIGCTGSGLLVLETYAKDWGRSEARRKAIDYLLKKPVGWGDPHFCYNLYHGSRAMARVGGRPWDTYREAMNKTLIHNQADSGAWRGTDAVSQVYGPNYTTAMAVLALTVEYRSRPIDRPSEEPTNKDK